MAIMMQALTSDNETEIAACLEELKLTNAGEFVTTAFQHTNG